MLTRELATASHYPAIDVLESVSRLSRDLLTEEQVALTGRAREAMAIYRRNQDLINIGAYPAGSSPGIDQAIRLRDPLQKFLRQPAGESVAAGESWAWLARACAPSEPVPAALSNQRA
jgi:flagellum-specific ATP synthase